MLESRLSETDHGMPAFIAPPAFAPPAPPHRHSPWCWVIACVAIAPVAPIAFAQVAAAVETPEPPSPTPAPAPAPATAWALGRALASRPLPPIDALHARRPPPWVPGFTQALSDDTRITLRLRGRGLALSLRSEF